MQQICTPRMRIPSLHVLTASQLNTNTNNFASGGVSNALQRRYDGLDCVKPLRVASTGSPEKVTKGHTHHTTVNNCPFFTGAVSRGRDAETVNTRRHGPIHRCNSSPPPDCVGADGFHWEGRKGTPVSCRRQSLPFSNRFNRCHPKRLQHRRIHYDNSATWTGPHLSLTVSSSSPSIGKSISGPSQTSVTRIWRGLLSAWITWVSESLFPTFYQTPS